MDDLNSNNNFNGSTGSDSPAVKGIIDPVAAAILGLVGGFILYQLIGGILTLLVFGFDLEAAPVNGLRLMTIAGQILFILLPAIIFTKLIYSNVSAVLYTHIPDFKEFFIFSIGIIVLIPMLQSYLYIQNFLIEAVAAKSEFIYSIKSALDSLDELITKTYSNLLAAENIPEMILVIIAVSIVPAVSEEVMFRGFIQRSFEFKMKPFRAALLTAVFFGLNHFSPYGIVPLIILGFYFGFAAYLSKSLLIPIWLHFLNNFSAIMLYFIIGDDEIIRTDVVDAAALGSNIIYFFVLLAIFGFIVYLIRKNYSLVKK